MNFFLLFPPVVRMLIIVCIITGLTYFFYRIIVNAPLSRDAQLRAWAFHWGLLGIPALFVLGQSLYLAMCNECIPDTPAGLVQKQIIPVVIVIASGSVMIATRRVVTYLPELRTHIRTRWVVYWIAAIVCLVPIGAFLPAGLLANGFGMHLSETTLGVLTASTGAIIFFSITGWYWAKYRANFIGKKSS